MAEVPDVDYVAPKMLNTPAGIIDAIWPAQI